MSHVASINDVSDSFLEKILETLLIPEQVTFAKVCRRFRNVFVNWAQTHSKHYTFSPDFESEQEREFYFRLASRDFNWRGGALIFTRQDQKLYFELVGPFIETVHNNLSAFALRVISTNCRNIQEISVPLVLDHLVPLTECRSLRSIYLLGNEDYSSTIEVIENFITCLTKLPNLTRLRIIKTNFHGEALSKLATLRELILIDCHNILSVNLALVFEKITRLEKLYLPNGLQYTELFRNMASSCQFLTELSCYVSYSVEYEILAQLPQLIYLQIWSIDEVMRQDFFWALAKYKSQQLQVLRIYNAQINLWDAYNIGKIEALRELKIILKRAVNNFEAIFTLEKLEYFQIYDCTDADHYITLNVGMTLPDLVSRTPHLRTIYLSHCRDLTIDFVHRLIPILSGMERFYEGPLRVFTYGTPLDECVLEDEQYKAAQDLIRVYYKPLTRPQVNSLSLMNCYFQ